MTMKLIKRNLLTFALCSVTLFTGLTAEAQIITKGERFIGSYKWRVGLGINMMDMNFNQAEKAQGAEMLSMMIPSKLTLAREIAPNLSVELAFSMNKIEKDNYANSVLMTEDKDIYMGDASLLYSLGGLFNIPYVDPYIKGGAGYLGFGDQNLTSVSIGGGLNFYLVDFGIGKDYRYPTEKWYSRFGVNVEAVGRKNITNDGPGSSLQYSAGIFYVFE